MFYKNLNIFGILTFEPKDYKSIINSIKSSRAYISYVDTSKDKGTINKRYENYLLLKQAAYTVKAPNRNKDPKMNKIYTTIMPSSISQKQIDSFLEEHGVRDDFEYEYDIKYKDQQSFVATHKVIPIEYSVFDSALDLDNNFENLNRQFLNESFLLNNHQRFFLIPFLGKYDGSYVKPFVVVNVYDVGIITIQVSIAISKEKVELNEDEPNSIQLTDVEFYKEKENYKSSDFWHRTQFGNATIYQILEYYTNLLKFICKNKHLTAHSQKQIAWVFGDFELNKRPKHQDFVNKNKGLYVAHLSNASKPSIDRMTDEYLDEYLEDTIIQKYKNMHFYCSEVISLLSFSYSAFHNEAVNHLKEFEKELKKEDAYDKVLVEIYMEQSLYTMFEFLRFYELTFIKRFYALNLLNELSSSSVKSLKKYNSIRNQFNSLKINYDQQLLFKSHGSPMELYGNLLEKSGTEKIVEKVEKLFTNAREDVNSSRELAIKQSETYILIMTSILTVLLGYRGIKYLVEDLLINLPYNIGTFFSLHPLWWTVSMWILLVIVMLLLNILRYMAVKK